MSATFRKTTATTCSRGKPKSNGAVGMSCLLGRSAELATTANGTTLPASGQVGPLRREVAGDVEDQLRDPGPIGIDLLVAAGHDRHVRGDHAIDRIQR